MMSWTKALGHRDRPIGDAVRQPSPCALPNAGADPYANTDNGLVAVVAFGNRFSAPVPAWVHGTTRDAGFLFVPAVAVWHHIAIYLGGGAALLAGAVTITFFRRPRVDPPIAYDEVPRPADEGHGRAPVSQGLERAGGSVCTVQRCRLPFHFQKGHFCSSNTGGGSFFVCTNGRFPKYFPGKHCIHQLFRYKHVYFSC